MKSIPRNQRGIRPLQQFQLPVQFRRVHLAYLCGIWCIVLLIVVGVVYQTVSFSRVWNHYSGAMPVFSEFDSVTQFVNKRVTNIEIEAAYKPWTSDHHGMFPGRKLNTEGQWGVPDFSSAYSIKDAIAKSCKGFPTTGIDIVKESGVRRTNSIGEMIRDVRQIDFRGWKDSVCILRPLALVEYYGDGSDLPSPPRPLHYWWRVPVFHETSQVIDSFLRTEIGRAQRWGIGLTQNPHIPENKFEIKKAGVGMESDSNVRNVWPRYQKSVSGESSRAQRMEPLRAQAAEEEPYLLYFQQAFVGLDGAVVDRKNRLYHMAFGSCYNPHKGSGERFDEMRNYVASFSTIDEIKSVGIPVYDRVFVIKQYMDDTYYHGLIESASRVFPWLDLVIQDDVKVVIGEKTQWMVQWLEFVGVNRDNIVELMDGETLFAREVYLPRPTLCNVGNAVQLRLMHEFINARLSHIPELSVDDNQEIMLFVARKHEVNRNIEDCAEVIEFMRFQFPQYTIDVFDGPSGDIAKDFARFRRARLIVGPRGGALANVVAARRGITRVIEVSNRWAANFFSEICGKLGLEYHLFTQEGFFVDATLDSEQGMAIHHNDPQERQISDIRIAVWPLSDAIHSLLERHKRETGGVEKTAWTAKDVEMYIGMDPNAPYREFI